MGRRTAAPDVAPHDSAREGDGKAYGLVLDARRDGDGNPTVPATPHTVAGLPGYYAWAAPTPVGGPGEASFEQALAASKDPGCGVTLVEVTDDATARAAQAQHVEAARGAVTELAAIAGEIDSEAEAERVNDEAENAGSQERV